ncbi:hypothetical protein BGX20_005872, partial [Mortierella sp. AD010]
MSPEPPLPDHLCRLHSISRFKELKAVPTIECHENASYIRRKDWAHIPQIWHKLDEFWFADSDFAALFQVSKTCSFAQALDEMDQWLEEFAALNPPLVWFFKSQMSSRNLSVKHFNLYPGCHISLNDILEFANEKWLSSSILDSIMGFFRQRYGVHHRHGNTIFIPTFYISVWESYVDHGCPDRFITYDDYSEMLSDKKSREKLRKGYAFVHINRNHWGAMAIDFKSHQFIFGDSMNNQVNSNAVKTARALMLRFGRIMDKDELRQWEGAEHRIGTMTIGDQRRGGSCGIIAANSIEYDINSTFDCDCETTCYRHCELWSHERSAFHRMRFMGLLADPGVPELDVFSREATGKAPPQVRRESSLLATGFGVTPPQLKRKSSLLDTYRLPPKV